ncbi:hypothetical protein L1987_82053 [Smallanthus sonchifolius]|uniref:Uncharacterized protein n=1 Tax=Smallanthus sonchifolius TaxID=185202 RepID=A0ACB8YSA6_9ASTR|nr:hypothetical protein L1987_82053 [Smallanthus sonchifolius]
MVHSFFFWFLFLVNLDQEYIVQVGIDIGNRHLTNFVEDISTESAMASAPNSYPYLCSSPPLPRTLNPPTKQTLSLITSPFKQTSDPNPQSLRVSIRLGNSSSRKQSVLIGRASAENGAEEEEKYEEYESSGHQCDVWNRDMACS